MPKILLLAGDGIGPEVTAEARKAIDWLNAHADLGASIVEESFGGASYDAHGVPITEAVLARACAADAVILGAVGGPKWAEVPRDKRPEAGLLALRTRMGVYANLRPAYCFPALADASTLKREHVSGLDLMFVRELVGGIYFGRPRGIEELPDGSRRGTDTQSYATGEIERVGRVAFDLARDRGNKVTSADKSNVMESGLLWRQVMTALHVREYADVALEHIYADNLAMQLVRAPKQFDVICTDNLFGDILSDEAAMLTGSLGMLPSAAIGRSGPGLYEPIHGSAPDIAGKGVANPLAAILSLQMALQWSLSRADLAKRLKAAVDRALDDGARSRDLGGDLGTGAMGDAVVAALAAA